MNRSVSHRAMALGAQRGDARHIQQAGVLRSVRSMASHATVPDSSVFKHERPTGFCVAFGADRVLIRGVLQVRPVERPVRIVAIRALRDAFVHLVVEGHRELGFLIAVALIAEVGLGVLQEVVVLPLRRRKRSCRHHPGARIRRAGLWIVDAVARGAAHVGLGVRRAVEISVLARVARQACLVDLLSGSLGRIEDFGCVAAAVHVSFAGSVAAFAGYAGSAVQEGQLTMRIVGEFFANFFMAGCASFATHKVARRGFCAASGG